MDKVTLLYSYDFLYLKASFSGLNTVCMLMYNQTSLKKHFDNNATIHLCTKKWFNQLLNQF